MLKVIHFEDNVLKHAEVRRVLQDHQIAEHEWVENVEEGIEKIEEAQRLGNPFELIITDMHYPVAKLGESDYYAGEKLIEMLQERKMSIPVIVCSSVNYAIREAYACVWYSENSNWEWELGKLVERIKAESN